MSHTKAKIKELWSQMINRSRLNVEFVPGSAEYDFALVTTRDLPIVYAELPQPRFCVISVRGYRGSYRALHIYKTNKWVPLVATKVFAASSSSATGSKKKRVLAQMRVIIKPQIDNFRSEVELPATCPLTGKILKTTNGKTVHVDHVYPFSRLVEEWLIAEDLNFEAIDLDRAGEFKDRSLAQKWYAFHKTMANLQLVDKTANLKKGNKV
jgi:hypothetical protein